MRISELSAQTGVPVATVKYYLREGLLPPGVRTSVNQAQYDEGHIERLRLIRALIEVGGVSVAGVTAVLAALDDRGATVHEVLSTVQSALTPRPTRTDRPGWAEARKEITDLLGRLRWKVRADAPALDQLTELLLTLRSVDPHLAGASAQDCFGTYAQVAEDLADAEIEAVSGAGPSEAARSAMLGAILGGRAFDALRRLAEEDASARTFGATPDARATTVSK